MSPLIAEAILIAFLSLCIQESTSLHQQPVVSVAQPLQLQSAAHASPSHRYVLVPFLNIPQLGNAVAHSPSQPVLLPHPSTPQAQSTLYLILPQSPQASLPSSIGSLPIVGSLQGSAVQAHGLSAGNGQSGVSPARPLLLSYLQPPSHLGVPNVGQTHAAVRPISTSNLQTLHQPVLGVPGSSPQRTVLVGSGSRLSLPVASQSLSSLGNSWSLPVTNKASGLQSPAQQDDHATKQRALEEAGQLIVRNKTLLLRLGDAMADALGETDFMLCPLVLEDNGLYMVVPPPGSAVLKCLPKATCQSLQDVGQDVCPCVPGSCALVLKLTRLCPLLHLEPEPPCAKAKNASRTASQTEAVTTTSAAASTTLQSTSPATEAATATGSPTASSEPTTTTAVDTTTPTTTVTITSTTTTSTASTTTTTTAAATTTTTAATTAATTTGSQCKPLVDCDMNTDFCNLMVNDLWKITSNITTPAGSAGPVNETFAVSEVRGPVLRSADMVFPLGNDLDGRLELSLSYFFYSKATLTVSVEFTPLHSDGTPVPPVLATIDGAKESATWTELKRLVDVNPGSAVLFILRVKSASEVKEAVAIDNVSLRLCP